MHEAGRAARLSSEAMWRARLQTHTIGWRSTSGTLARESAPSMHSWPRSMTRAMTSSDGSLIRSLGPFACQHSLRTCMRSWCCGPVARVQDLCEFLAYSPLSVLHRTYLARSNVLACMYNLVSLV